MKINKKLQRKRQKLNKNLNASKGPGIIEYTSALFCYNISSSFQKGGKM